MRTTKYGPLFLAVLAIGCGDGATDNANDGGVIIKADGGVIASLDSGTPVVDSGTLVVDSGTLVVDSGTPVVDSGTPVVDSGTLVVDSGTPVVDSGTPVVDSGTPVVDAGAPVDAGTSAPIFNGCSEGLFNDRTGTAMTTVLFQNFQYSPKCISVPVGHQVVFSGAFLSHPLSPGVFGNTNAGTIGTPIVATTSGNSATFTFSAVGEYPYFCTAHGSFGMSGVVRVR